MALQAAVIDVPLSTTNQIPGETMGPSGRLQNMINCKVSRYLPHFTGTQGVVPAKIRVEPRDAFNSLPATARSVVDGTSVSPTWNQQRLLGELDAQLVSVCGGSVPRVFNGQTWSTYVNNAVLTQKLSQNVLHTSQHTIQAPDQAWMNGVTCAVWTETTVGSTGPLTTSYVGFKADNGTWLVKPTALYASNSSVVAANARVVQDGTNFWVFHGTSVNGIVVTVYDVHGALLNSFFNITPPLHNFVPSGWDVTAVPSTGGYTVLCAVVTDGTSDSGVTLTALKISSGTVAQNAVAVTSPTIHANWQIAFLTNDTGNGRAYLATVMSGGTEQIWAYEITNQAVTNTYNTGVSVALGIVDTVAGYVTSGAGAAVIISYCALPDTVGASGPLYDPQRRLIHSFACVAPNVTTHIRTTQSMCQVSRAFAIDGAYYVMGYYQSGSGLTITPITHTFTGQNGDTMIGAATQPITVQAGDGTEGSPIALTGASGGGSGNPNIRQTTGGSAVAILAGDWVRVFRSINTPGVPDGTALWEWYFQNQSAGGGSVGSRITISGSTISGANTTWDVIDYDTIRQTFYTLPSDINGHIPFQAGATFAAGGTIQEIGMVGYQVQNLAPILTGQVANSTYIGGSITVAGSNFSNGTFTVARVYLGTGPTYNTVGTGSVIWVQRTTQTGENHTFTGTLSGDLPNSWTFRSEVFDSSYIGTNLVISADPALPTNVGTYPITSVVNNNLIDTSGTWLPQIFSLPYPTASIQLTTQVPYTFKFAAVTPDYTYQGAIMVLQGATDATNNGSYKIVQINADGSFVALPTNGLSNQVNEALGPSQTVTFFLASSVSAPFQSTWFIVPISGTQPVAGRFEYGLAYADWRTEGDATNGMGQFPMCLSSPATTASGLQFTLPYRAQNVTSSVTQVTAAGQVDVGDVSYSSTVGLKQFLLGPSAGHAYANSGELLIPGPMASTYTASGFFEDGINLALEQPFLVSQSAAAGGQLALAKGATYIYVAVAEQTDENGNRIFSPPSPPLVVNMGGANNVATIGGRLMFPLGSTGAPVANTYGPTTRQVTVSIYRTVWINGVPTTTRRKITNDLNPNGLAPVSTLNPSGFSFPDSFTWNYVDQNADSEIQATEILYTDKGYLPRYPAPAFTAGVGSWHNREWVIGYDGAIWMSGEKTEGDAIWFNPLFRYVLPTDDKPLGIAAMEDYLVVTCASSLWYIPAAQFPDATGQNGGLPTPVRLPFQNGSVNGLTQTIREGVAYDSTAGGVWLITRSLDNVWLSHDVLDSLATPVVDLALDKQQRLFVLQQSGPIMVYDGIPAAWYTWQAPTVGVLLATYAGQVVYQDGANVNAVVPGQAADVVGGTTYGIAPDITISSLGFANVRGVKRVWEFQIVGSYLGPHRANVVLSYPEDGYPDTTYAPFTPGAGVPYILPFNPLLEAAAQYGVRIFADFVGINTPGLTFAVEMISAQVGLEAGIGIKKLPPGVTLTAR